MIYLFEASVFLFQFLLDGLALESIDKRSFDVGSFHHPRVSFLLRLKVLSFHQLVEFVVLCLTDYLFGVVFKQIQHYCLLPYSFLQLANPFSKRHLVSWLCQAFILFSVCLLHHFFQIFESLRQFREQLNFSLIIFSLFSCNFFLNISNLRGEQFYAVSGLCKEAIECVVVSLNADDFEAKDEDEDNCAYGCNFLYLFLVFSVGQPFTDVIRTHFQYNNTVDKRSQTRQPFYQQNVQKLYSHQHISSFSYSLNQNSGFKNIESKCIIQQIFQSRLQQIYFRLQSLDFINTVLQFIIKRMLLYRNKKNNREIHIHSKRQGPRTVSPNKPKARLIQSPNFGHDKVRLFRTIELKCQGMKLKTRDIRIPESIKRKISQTISRTVPLMKPVLSMITPPVFSSLQIKTNNFMHSNQTSSAINPESTPPQPDFKFIPYSQIILSASSKRSDMRPVEGYYVAMNRYVGLHQYQNIVIPKVKGVLEEWGICEMENGEKYFVSQPYLNLSFRNLIGQFGKFEEYTAKNFLKQLISTVATLHQLGRCHNRLNMDSIIHDCQGSLLINFFKAKTSPINTVQKQQYMHYFSPQVLISKTGHQSFKNDIWAIGTITLQFLSNKPIKFSKNHPYNKTSLSKSTLLSSTLYKKIKQNNTSPPQQIQEHVSRQALNFIRACLQSDEMKRPTAKQLLSHPYLQN